MIYERVFRHWLQAKYRWLNELLCVFDINIYIHNIVYYQSNMTCLVVLIMKLHIPKCVTFYISLKITKLPTLEVQYGLEGIVIKLLPGINQSKDKITSNSWYPSMLPSQEEWGPIVITFKINCLWYTRGFSDIDCKLNIDGSLNCCVYLI